jgi:hypothetical protein
VEELCRKCVSCRSRARIDPLNSWSAAEATQRNFHTEQAFHYQTLFLVYYAMGGVDDELPATVLTLLMLFTIMNVAILLKLLRPTFRTRVAHAHGHLLPPLLSVRDTGYS